MFDEPNESQIEQYKLNKKNLEDVLKGWKVLDALSHVEFYKQGLCEKSDELVLWADRCTNINMVLKFFCIGVIIFITTMVLTIA